MGPGERGEEIEFYFFFFFHPPELRLDVGFGRQISLTVAGRPISPSSQLLLLPYGHILDGFICTGTSCGVVTSRDDH